MPFLLSCPSPLSETGSYAGWASLSLLRAAGATSRHLASRRGLVGSGGRLALLASRGGVVCFISALLPTAAPVSLDARRTHLTLGRLVSRPSTRRARFEKGHRNPGSRVRTPRNATLSLYHGNSVLSKEIRTRKISCMAPMNRVSFIAAGKSTIYNFLVSFL